MMENIIVLLDYLGKTGFLRNNICEYLKEFISKMKVNDIDEASLVSLQKELSNNCYKPIDSPQCHWLTGSFKKNRLFLAANAVILFNDISSEEIDKMVYVYLKINEKIEFAKPC